MNWVIIKNTTTGERRAQPEDQDLPLGYIVEASTANPDVLNPDTQVPNAVTMRQARLALLHAGKLHLIPLVIDSLSSPTKEAAIIEWEYSSEVQRHNGFVSQIGPALGMSSADIDALFILAKGL